MSILKTIYKNGYLFRQLVKKDIAQRYQGSILGMLWPILVPIMMLIIYTFVFSEVFQAKWDIDTSDKYQFALVLFCGLTSFNVVSETMSRATTLVLSNVNYVKKVIFPLELLTPVTVCTALFNCSISFIILILAKFILYHDISPTLYQIILAFIPLVLLAGGLSFFVSAISVYLRDVGNFISILITVLMYVSPVFFPLTAVPDSFRTVCEANPMTFIIENFRNVILYNKSLDWKAFAISCLVSLSFYLIGIAVFKRAKEGFADVL